MTKNLHFDEIIKNVTYDPQINDDLMVYDFSDFEVNAVLPQGIIELPHERLGYSIWDSPIQSTSKPFARIYKTYGTVEITQK